MLSGLHFDLASPLPAAAAGWLCHNYMATYLTIKRCYQFSHKIISCSPSRLGATIWRLVEYVRILPINRAWPKPHENEKLKVENECVRKWTEGEQRQGDRQTERQTDRQCLVGSSSHKYFLTILCFSLSSSLSFPGIFLHLLSYVLCNFARGVSVVFMLVRCLQCRCMNFRGKRPREREWGRERRR